MIENQPVSRFLPLITTACRNVPSKRKPSRFAAATDGAFKLSHFHL